MKRLFATSFAALALTVSSFAFAQEHGDPQVHRPPPPANLGQAQGHEPGHGFEQTHGEHGTIMRGQAHGQEQGGAQHVGGHGEGAAHAEHAEHHVLDPINWFDKDGRDSEGKPQIPMIALIVNAGILFWLIYSKGRKPVADALKNRRKEIGSAIVNARRMLKEAKGRAKIYQAQLENVVEDTKAAKESLVHAGVTDRERIVREAEEKAARMDRDAVFLVDQEKKQLHADLVRETVERSIKQAEELIQKRMTQADQERLAEDFLSQILAKRAANLSMPPRGASMPPAASVIPPAPASPPNVKLQGDAE